jgi:tRNA A-37 threonylcarbamoyl transferase component Bud32
MFINNHQIFPPESIEAHTMLRINIDSLRKDVTQYVEEFYRLREAPTNTTLVDPKEKAQEQWVVPLIDSMVHFAIIKQELQHVTKIFNGKDGKDCLIKKKLTIEKPLAGNRSSPTKFLLSNGQAAKIIPIYNWGSMKNELRDKAQNEMELTAKAAQLNIAPKMHDAFICCSADEHMCYSVVISDYVQGQNLVDWLATNPSKSERQRLHDLFKAKLNTMHSAGILHRNLWEENVIVVTAGAHNTVKDVFFTDFHSAIDMQNKKLWDTNNLVRMDRHLLPKVLSGKTTYDFNLDEVKKYVAYRLIKANKIILE